MLIEREHIEKRFNAWIKWKFKKKDIRKFLLRHERKDLCINNILDQVRTAQIKKPQWFDTAKAAKMIDWGVRMFCDAAIKHKHESTMSDIEKQKIMVNKEADYEAEQKELRKEFKVDDTANDKSL